MEQQSYNYLPFRHISSAADEAVTYMKKRKNREIEPLKTRWERFNKLCNGGIEPGCVYAIAGISGSGKSSFVNTLETDLITYNPTKDIVILSFSLEMLSSRQVGRKISSKLRQTTSQLYSAEYELSDSNLNAAINAAEDIKNYPVYYVDAASDVNRIAETIAYFQNVIAKDKWLVVILDHTLLIKGGGERSTIIDLQNLFIEVKKIGTTSIIQITQMNRNIETSDRINNQSGHYPMRSDLSSSDSIFQGSDIVAVIHRPETLGIMAYGLKRLPVQNKVYLHFLKNREGEVAIIEFENDLKYNNLLDPVQKD